MINEYNAKRYCKEDISKIENYEQAIADKTQTWECHHRTEIWWNCTEQDLKDNECYYDRKALELIFVTKAEHKSLHHAGKILSADTKKKMSESAKGRTFSDETRQKISKALKGERNPNYGRPATNKGKPMSDEQKRKIAEARKAYWAKRRAAEGR